MKRNRLIALILAALLLTLCACQQTPAQNAASSTASAASTASTASQGQIAAGVPLMWKVTDAQGHVLYLFGTVHVGDERSETVLEQVTPVLDSCDALAVEFDIAAYNNDAEVIKADMMKYVLTDGTTVTDHMPADLYERVKTLLTKADMYSPFYDYYNLAMWDQLVEQAVLATYSDLDAEYGFDTLLINHAYDKEMPVLEVESAEFQSDVFNSFDDETNLLLIEKAVGYGETYGTAIEKLYSLWLSGDRDAFWRYMEEEDDEEFTEAQRALLEEYNRVVVNERNLGMRDKAISYLASGDTVFFAVGAAHMAWDTGIVKLLSDAGCTVEPYAYTA